MKRIEELERENEDLKRKIVQLEAQKKTLYSRNTATKHNLKLVRSKLNERENTITDLLNLLEVVETSLLEILSRQKYTEPAEDCLLMKVKKMVRDERKKL